MKQPLYLLLVITIILPITACSRRSERSTTQPVPASMMITTTRPVIWKPRETILKSSTVMVPLHAFNTSPFVDVTIGDTEIPFEIDTGSQNTFILAPVAEIQKLPNTGSAVVSDDAGGSVNASLTHLSSLMIGGIQFKDFDAEMTAVHAFEGGRSPPRTGGIIGWAEFTDVLLTIDFKDQFLRIHRGNLPPPDGQDILPIRKGDNGWLSIPVTLNGSEIWLYPDTGCGVASNVVLPKTMQASLKWHSPPIVVISPNAFGDSTGTMGRLDGELRIGRHIIQQPLALVDCSRDRGLIGSRTLSNYIVTFDFKNMRMRLDSQAPEPVFAPGYADITFSWAGKKVTSVSPGGAAEKSGVLVGDELVSVSGESPKTDGTIDWSNGKTLVLELQRNGKIVKLDLGIRPQIP